MPGPAAVRYVVVRLILSRPVPTDSADGFV
jgi:hypothetical protein